MSVPVLSSVLTVCRSYRSILRPLVLAATTSATYSVIPRVSSEDAPYQAAWVATGVSISTCLIQSILENSEEVRVPGRG